MSIAALIKEAAQAGVFLFVEDGKLGFKLSVDTFPAELKGRIVAAKPELIDYLARLALQKSQAARPAIDKRPGDLALIPPSFGQQRLWFIDTLEGGSSHYNIPLAFEFDGVFDVAMAELAMSRIIERHEVIRTTIQARDDEPYQHINEHFEFRFERIDLSGLSAIEQQQKVNELVAKDAARSFDLTQDLMVRACVLVLNEAAGKGRYVVLFNMHHIASDGWSMQLLTDEFFQQYDAVCRGLPDPMPPLPIQYADYAYWQRQFLQGEVLEKQLNYWQNQLEDLPQSHGLMLDHERPLIKGHQGFELLSNLDMNVAKALKAVAKVHQVTPFVLLHGLVAILLSRHSGTADIIVGTPIANRQDRALESLIGFFANTLVLRVDTKKTDLTEYLAHVKQVNLDAQAHQDVPFEHLVDVLKVPRDTSHTPLFQILFTADWDENLAQAQAQDGGAMNMLGGRHASVKFDLEVAFKLTAQGLDIKWVYDIGLFKDETIKRLNDHLLRLLRSVASAPMAKLADLNYLSEAELKQLMVDFRPPALPHEARLIHQLFEAQAAEVPDKIAVTYGAQSINYGELNRKANRLAAWLREQGVARSSFVGISLNRGIDMVMAVMAVLKAGGAYVPLDPKYPADRLAFMAEDTGVCLILSDRPGDNHVMIDELPLSAYSSDNLASLQTLDSLAYIIYTSGSTGKPKGVMLTHGNAVALVQWAQAELTEKAAQKVLGSTSLNFDLSVFELFFTLSQGYQLTMVDDAFAMIDRDVDATLLNSVPSVVDTLLAQGAIAPSINTVMTAGEALSAESINALLALPHIEQVYHLYGPSEDTTYSSGKRFDKPTQGKPSIGKIFDGSRGYIVTVDGALAPVGVPGELLLGGAGVGLGYLNREALTKESFIADPFDRQSGDKFYRSGDVVRYLANGELQYVTRIDNQVKIRGFRIEPGEIEHQINQLAAVERSLVMPIDKRLVAYVVSQSEDKKALVDSIREQIAGVLPDYMVPAAFVVLKTMPLTSNGKVDKRALPQPDGTQLQGRYIAPTTAQEQVLVEIWAALLKLDEDKLSVTANFFELGGDSILSIQVVSRAAKQGLHFSVQDLFKAQSIRKLALLAADNKRIDAPQTPVEGLMSLLPIQQAFFENLQDWRHYNQSVMLHCPADFTVAQLTQLIDKLVERHDVLRLQFASVEGQWQGVYGSSGVVVEACEVANFDDALIAGANTVQRSLQPDNGCVMKAVLFSTKAASEPVLLLCAHHLVIDGVSWRIVLQDLESLYIQLSHNQPLSLPPKTSSFKQWVECLGEFAQSQTFAEERQYWQQALAVEVQPLAKEAQGGERESVDFALDAELTARLLSGSHHAYNTQINELLLAAMLLGFKNTFGSSAIRIDLEGHGREHLSDSLDLSETLGWFTTIYPLTLQLEGDNQLRELICGVKEQYRAVPRNGIGFGIGKYVAKQPLFEVANAEIVFNYLGQFDQVAEVDSFFRPAALSSGDNVSPLRQDNHPMMFDGMVANSQLGFRLSFLSGMFELTQMQQLMSAIKQGLTDIIEHCSNTQTRFFTPSDFPLASVDAKTLNQWQQAVEMSDLYPATGMQKGMLFHHMLDSGSYVTQTVLSIDELELELFKRAWQQVIDHIDVFRTTFVGIDSTKPHQRVQKQAQMRWFEFDLSDMSEHQQEQYLNSFLVEDKLRGVDLSTAPLMHMSVFNLGANRKDVVWTYHHALLDGWCTPLVFAMVTQCYQALVAGREATLPGIPPFREYARFLAERDEDKDRRYWQQQLAELSGPTPLPLMHGFEKGEEIATHFAALDKASSQLLAEMAKRCHTTMNVVFQAAWALLLSRYAFESKVVFGATTSGRPAELIDVEQMIGLFINTVPVVVDIDSEQTLGDWLKALHQQLIEREAHSYMPLPEIQRQAGFSGSLFDSLVIFENFPQDDAIDEKAADADLKVGGVHTFEQTNYPLTIFAHMTDTLSFKIDCLSAKVAETLSHQLLELLKGFTQAEQTQIRQIPLLSQAEQAEVDACINGKAGTVATQDSVVAQFEKVAEQHPQAVAITFEGQSCSYAELNAKANQFAHYLSTQNITQGDLVALCLERGPKMLAAMLGIMKVGAAYVPLDPDYPAERIDYIVNAAGARFIINDHNSDVGAMAQHNPGVAILADTLAYVIFTSGSSGNPKGVMIEHGALSHFLSAMAARVGNGRKWLAVTTVAFDIAGLELFGPLLCGGEVVLAAKATAQDPNALMALIDELDIDYMQATPVTWQAMLAQGWQGKSAFTALCGGEAMPIALAQSLSDCCSKVFNCYGPTEATIWSLVRQVKKDEALASSANIGHSLDGYRHYVLDCNGHRLPVGAVGQLYIAGPALARGYLNNPELTAQTFISKDGERLYATGDLVRIEADGQLVFMGRADNQVKVRGYRIELGEIEYRLSELDGIEQAVVSVDQQLEHGRLVAYVVVDGEIDEAQWRLALERHLPAYMVPSVFIMLSDLPRTPNGKVDRKRLPTFEGKTLSAAVIAPQSDMERAVADCFAQVLKIKETQVCVEQAFFDMGGDSLLILPLLEQINGIGSSRIALRDVYECRNVRNIAAKLVEAQPVAQVALQSMVKLNQSSAEAKLFLVHPIVGFVNCYMALAQNLASQVSVYGVQAPYCYKHRLRFDSLAELGDFYAQGIEAVQPQGPYHIGGWSAGGTIACYVIDSLRRRGHQVTYAALLEPSPLDGFAGFDAFEALKIVITTILDGHQQGREAMLVVAEQYKDSHDAVNQVAEAMQGLGLDNFAELDTNLMYLQAGMDYFLGARPNPEFAPAMQVRLVTCDNEGTLGGEDYRRGWQQRVTQPMRWQQIRGIHSEMMEGQGLEDITELLLNDLQQQFSINNNNAEGGAL